MYEGWNEESKTEIIWIYEKEMLKCLGERFEWLTMIDGGMRCIIEITR